MKSVEISNRELIGDRNSEEIDNDPSLASIFRRNLTDKLINGYADFYDCLFWKNRLEVKAVLEIGIGTMIPGVHSSMVGFAPEGYLPGASLRSWRDFFPHAIIYGLDVQPDTQFDNEKRIVTFLCDSTNAVQVEDLMQKLGHIKFDIIIDDGSHTKENQIATLKNFFPLVRESGTYVIEDIVYGGLFHHPEEIRSVCGASPFFFAGPQNNPVAITKRGAGRI
jgi:hypothetical protein